MLFGTFLFSGDQTIVQRWYPLIPMRKTKTARIEATDKQEPNRRTRILLEAGKLFGEKGYNGVSMRELAEAADVQLSSIVYHFSTKENLYRSVFDYFHDIFEARIELLRKITDLTTPDAVRKIVEAFVRPIQQIQTSETGRIYCLLVMRATVDQNELDIVQEYYDPMAREFIAALRTALPDKTKDQIVWAYLFAAGSLVMNVTGIERRMERLVDGDVSSDNVERKFNYLINYICAGILNA